MGGAHSQQTMHVACQYRVFGFSDAVSKPYGESTRRRRIAVSQCNDESFSRSHKKCAILEDGEQLIMPRLARDIGIDLIRIEDLAIEEGVRTHADLAPAARHRIGLGVNAIKLHVDGRRVDPETL